MLAHLPPHDGVQAPWEVQHALRHTNLPDIVEESPALERLHGALIQLELARERGLNKIFTPQADAPEAALIPYEEFLRFQVLQEKDVLARFDRLVARMAEQNAPVSEEEVAADAETARAELDR